MPQEERGPRRLIKRDHRVLFGKTRDVPWQGGTAAERSAAYRQHLLALAVHEARRENGWSIEELAEHVGMGAETLRRKLRGETWIGWIDGSALALAFEGVTIFPDATEVMPPT